MNPVSAPEQKKGDRAEAGRPRISDMQHVMERMPPVKPRPYAESKVELVTPDRARRLRDTAHFERQRNISPHNVKRLATAMAAGQFVPGTQVYICFLPDGRELIVNGNHTLEAVAACGVPQILTITRKLVMDENEAGEIYATFDIQKVRSWRDSMRAIGADENLPMADTVLAAVRFIDGGFKGAIDSTSSRVNQIAKVEEYRLAAQQWADAIYGGPTSSTKLLQRAAVAAIALIGFRYQPSFAHEFWSRIAQDNGLTNDMPEKALLNWLRNVRGTSGSSSRIEHAKASAAAWNAAWRGEKRTYVKPNQMTTFFMLGTPYANGLGEV